MERLRGIVLVLFGIFLLSWYASAIIQSPVEFSKTIETDATYDEVKKSINSYNPDKVYTFKYSVTIRKQKTYIPFVYKRDTLLTTNKMLFSKTRTGCD